MKKKNELNRTKSRTGGTNPTKNRYPDSALLQRWRVLKMNAMVVTDTMIPKAKEKADAIAAANVYAKKAKGWDIVITIDSESDFIDDSVAYAADFEDDSNKKRKREVQKILCFKRKKSPKNAVKFIAVPNTNVICTLKTFRHLVVIIQKDQLKYSDCVREYYAPIVDGIWLFGRTKFHVFLWIAILLTAFSVYDMLSDFIIYIFETKQDNTATSQTYTGIGIILYLAAGLTSGLAFIYGTQMGVVTGRLHQGMYYILILNACLIVVRIIMEFAVVDYRPELFTT